MLTDTIAAETLPGDVEMRDLARHHQLLLEDTLTRHLQHLKEIKESIKAVGSMNHDQLRELKVWLRLVR